MKGEKVSKEGLEKIAKDATLTTPVILALVQRMREYTGPADYMDPRPGIISRLAERARQLTPEGALALIKYIPSSEPAGETYWPGRYSLETLIKNAPLTPEAFRDLAQKADDATISLILRNPNCPADIIESLANRMSEINSRELKNDIWRALIKRGTITAEQMREAMAAGAHGYGGLAYEIFHNPEMSARLTPELLRLVPVRNADELKRFLTLPNVPADLTADLISQHWRQLKKKDLYDLLQSVNLPTEMIERIWNDKDVHIRTALLQNPSIGAVNAATFAGSRNSAYRFAVAHNTVTPPESLQILAGDESASTRAAVAANPNTPAETLRVLAGDEATVVRAGVASNPKAPRNVLDALKRDSDEFVRKTVRKTLKSLETAEAFIALSLGMHGHLFTEELTDDDGPNTMSPHWSEIPVNSIKTTEFVAIYLLQNNGSANREDIEAAFQQWNPQRDQVRYYGSRFGRRRAQTVRAKNVWQIIKNEEEYNETPTRTTSAGGRGWWWSPPGINKGALVRLTPRGAAAALESLQAVRNKYISRQWSTREQPPVKRSPPPAGLNPQAAAAAAPAARTPGAPRGPKTTYKIYGRFKGRPVATRLKGQAYVPPVDITTQFSPGEQAEISPGENGKLNVKKTGGDHTQEWEPIDG